MFVSGGCGWMICICAISFHDPSLGDEIDTSPNRESISEESCRLFLHLKMLPDMLPNKHMSSFDKYTTLRCAETTALGSTTKVGTGTNHNKLQGHSKQEFREGTRGSTTKSGPESCKARVVTLIRVLAKSHSAPLWAGVTKRSQNRYDREAPITHAT